MQTILCDERASRRIRRIRRGSLRMGRRGTVANALSSLSAHLRFGHLDEDDSRRRAFAHTCFRCTISASCAARFAAAERPSSRRSRRVARAHAHSADLQRSPPRESHPANAPHPLARRKAIRISSFALVTLFVHTRGLRAADELRERAHVLRRHRTFLRPTSSMARSGFARYSRLRLFAAQTAR